MIVCRIHWRPQLLTRRRQVKEQLEGVAELPVWGQAAPANDFNLPAFSAYPLPHVTAAGAHLLYGDAA